MILSRANMKVYVSKVNVKVNVNKVNVKVNVNKVNEIYSIHSHYKGNHKRGGAASGRASSFAVSFVVAVNRVDVVALNTIFVLRLSKSGRTVGRTDSRLDGWSVGRTDRRSVGYVVRRTARVPENMNLFGNQQKSADREDFELAG